MARKIGRVRQTTVLEVGKGGDGRVHMAGGRRCQACVANLMHHHHNSTVAIPSTDPAISPATASSSTNNAIDSDDDSSDTLSSDSDLIPCALRADITTCDSVNSFSQRSTEHMTDVFTSDIYNLSANCAIPEAFMPNLETNHSPRFRNVNVTSPFISTCFTNAFRGSRIRDGSDRAINCSFFNVGSPAHTIDSTITPEAPRTTSTDDISRSMVASEDGLNVILAFNLVGSTSLV